MYGLYKTSYQISDEIQRQKDNEKPFWWEHLHSEVRDKPLEEIEQMLKDANVPEDVIKGMDRKEKYLAVSAGCYAIDHSKLQQQIDAQSKTGFLNEGDEGNEGLNNEGAEGSLPPSGSASTGHNPIDFKPGNQIDEPSEPPTNTGSANLDEEGFKRKPGEPLDGAVPIVTPAAEPPKKSSPVEIRKIAVSVVKDAVNKINTKAEALSIETYPDANMDILRAVINELQTIVR